MIELYNPTRFMDSGTLLDNVLFGKVSEKYRDGADQIRAVLISLLHEIGTFGEVLNIGLNFDVGPSGRRLSPAQRQKIALARALVRQSDYYVFNRPLSTLDSRSQERVLIAVLDRWRKTGQRPGVLWVLVNPAVARHFDRIAVFSDGRLVEEGSFDTLLERNGIFKDMIGS
jgi:putative ABC transport system ATP-binding protein